MTRGKTPFATIHADAIEWVFVDRNKQGDTDVLRKKYRFSVLDLDEVPPPVQRPKVVARDGYIFMILLYPFYDKKTRDVRTTEVDFFITEERLVTVNADRYAPLSDLFRQCMRNNQHTCMSGDITQLLYTVLNEMTTAVFPMLLRVNADLDALEGRLFSEYEKGMIQELLLLKTNIATIRRTMQGHETVIRNLMRVAPGYFPLHRLPDYFDELASHAKEIWDTLDVQKDTADALHETNQSLIDYRINEIIKTLTIFSVIVFPLTLMAAIFGMNVVNMPIVSHPQGFWILLGLMALGTGCMLALFKKKGWI